MEEDEVGNINFIPCVCFVKRGVAKANPDKITLTQEELARVIKETKREIDEAEDDDDENDEEMEVSDVEGNPSSTNIPVSNTDDEFNFADYDDENQAGPDLGIGDIAAVDTEPIAEDEDSEAEDDIIKPSDNLILVGHVEDDSASLEVYIYNEQEDSLYVHHDFLLPSFPLCIEWLSYDAGSNEPGNLCAIGSMDPIITIWDLDIQDSLEPTFKLGSKGSRKRNLEKYGHTDAVLDLSWNQNFSHILASGSVDQTVLLWDLDEGKPHTTIKDFGEKVQTLSFHPTEAQTLLTGCCDGMIKIFDCRNLADMNTQFKSWNLDGEIERAAWNQLDSNYFFASTNKGLVYYMDMRQDGSPVWSKQMHDEEASGLVIGTHTPGFLVTSSSDNHLKVWKYNESGANLVYSADMKVGKIQCLSSCPENSLTLAIGGDFRKKHFKVLNLMENESVQTAFRS